MSFKNKAKAAFCLHIILALFIFSNIVAKSSDGDLNNLSDPSQFLSSLSTGEEIELLYGKGPFEISGDPESFAVAWIDRESGGKYALRSGIFEADQFSSIRLISGDVDETARIFLRKDTKGVVLIWKENDGWHLEYSTLTGNASSETSVSAQGENGNPANVTMKLKRGIQPLAISLKEDTLALLAIPDRSDGKEMLSPALFEIDLKHPETRMLYQFSEDLISASLSFRNNNWTVTATEAFTRNLTYLEIDPSGSIIDFRQLNNFPVASISPTLKEVTEKSFAGWIENRPIREIAILGLLARGESGSLYALKEMSSPDRNALNVLFSEGSGIWVLWTEEIEGNNLLRVLALDLEGNPVCLYETALDDSIEKFWLLEDGQNALLFRQKQVSRDRAVITAQEISCDQTVMDVEQQGGTGVITSLAGDTQFFGGDQFSGMSSLPPGEQSLLGGGADPCDGFDNNGDGTIDEGCDNTCDAPQKSGSDRRITTDSALSQWPSMVWTGSQYAISWSDSRNVNEEIYFARIDESGTKIGSDIRVTNDYLVSTHPSIVWTGTEYGIAWHDSRNGDYEIYFARLDTAGNKIGSDLRVSAAAQGSIYPSMVWAGTEYGIAWQDYRDGNDEIYFARVSYDGIKLTTDIRITNNVQSSLSPSLAWKGSEYGVSWNDNRDGNNEIYFARLSSSGVKIGSDIRVTQDPSFSSSASLVWTGNQFGVTWYDRRDGNDEIYFARLDSLGSKIGSDQRITSAAGTSDVPFLTWNGNEFGVLWLDDRDGNDEIYLARISAAGSKIGSDARLTSDAAASYHPSLVWNGIAYAASWHDDRDLNKEIYFAPIGCCDNADADAYTECDGDCNDADPNTYPGASEICDGRDNDCDATIDEGCDRICDVPETSGSDVRVTMDPGTSYYPSMVWTGSEYGMAYYDNRDGNLEIYFDRLDSAGNKIGSDIRVTSDANSSYEPSLVWTGTHHAIAWRDFRDGNGEIYFTRLDTSGNKVGSDIRLTNDTGNGVRPSLIWTGREYGVSWYDSRDGNGEIYFCRMDQYGNKVRSDVRITSNSAGSWNPSLAWTGNEYGVAWYDYRDSNYEIYFARLDANGKKIGSDIRVTSDIAISQFPSLIWNGSEYGLSWYDERDGNGEIYFVRLDSTGTKIGTDIRVTQDAAASTRPSLTWTGEEYGIAWNDSRDGNPEIYLTTLDSTGTKLSADLRITAALENSHYPSLVWNGSEYAVSWFDYRDLNNEIYFALTACCNNVDGDPYTDCQGDCDDNDPDVYPGASQICDGKNNDCDDPNWPEIPADETDDDTDTFAECQGDCDDADADIYPGASQICDGKNNDCDDPNWPALTGTNENDDDTDTFSECAGDCNDGDASVYPGASQICDGKNNDCNDPSWPALTGTNEYDDDTDTYTECAGDCDDADADVYPGASQICDGKNNDCNDAGWPTVPADEIDNDLDTLAECQGDCDDADADIYPGASQICDGKNNDCNDPSWPALTGTNEYDDDTDTFTECAGDCDDSDADIYPGASQICDGKNNDCNDPNWPALTGTNEYDDDTDTFTECAGDCDDTDADIYPGASQLCDGKNNDCNDANWPTVPSDEIDDDLDTLAECQGDCDDADADIYPGASQICDGKNNDCNDPNWPALTGTNEYDDDTDTFTECVGDCDDTDADIYPGASQICDGKNNDCNDPNWPVVPSDEIDDDLDTLAECQGDCDDADADIYPGASQICDGKNNDCNDPNWPALTGTNEYDDDTDTYTECTGDCDDGDVNTYPGAPQICDGKNNDCSDPNYPTVPPDDADADNDTYAECEGDCNDADSAINPGATEICDYLDNNCDGTVDEGFVTPGSIQGFVFENNKQTLRWDTEVDSYWYDVVRGDLNLLRSSGGDFTVSLSMCLKNNNPVNKYNDASFDPPVGEGYYYLVRGQTDCRHGTYNTPDPKQIGDRDAEIEASSNKCP